MPDFAQQLQLLSIMALPFLMAVTLHEAGHAFVANGLGDPTPKIQGRLSLNPLTHIDPFGTIFLPIMALMAGAPFMIGYAKPVLIEPRYFKKYRRDMILVALAGPFGNFLVAVFFAYILRFAPQFGFGENDWLTQTAQLGVLLNCLFMVFNLLPIPPLDGSKVIMMFMPQNIAQAYERIAPFGFFILIAILLMASEVIVVPTLYAASMIAWMVGVPL